MIERKKIWVPEPHMAQVSTDKFDEKITHPLQVVVQNMYSHISAGTELACIAGLESFFTIPDTPGYTAIGKVLSTGLEVEGIKEGDLVYTYGPHAEFFTIDISDRWHGICVKLPAGLDPQLAAFTHMAGIAMTALRSSRVELGDDVLVTGLGAIGNLAAQLVQLQGGRVVASDPVRGRVQTAVRSGIVHAVNPGESDLSEYLEKVFEGCRPSTYIDATGNSAVIKNSLDLVALYGEVILLGSPRAPYETELSGLLQHFHLLPWSLQLKGALEFTFPTHETEFVKHSIERNARIVMDLIFKERLQIRPLFTHLIKPEEIQSAYDGLKENPEKYLGVVIDWTDN